MNSCSIMSQTLFKEFLDTSKGMAARVDIPARMECCPSETHLILLRGGVSRNGKLLEIYREKRRDAKILPDIFAKPMSSINLVTTSNTNINLRLGVRRGSATCTPY
ncbi:unnamed protein product [Lymnaea stagnalis]|uniref:Uncharacterized protein n=1 Tax=Lymnaea stagnalis TaxID=6523 RepID=A0AAV2IM56_LYMST